MTCVGDTADERTGAEGTDEAEDGRYVAAILTPDQRVRVFVSSTMEELAEERVAVRQAVDRMHLSPVLFELGARAHPPRSLYRSYLEQSHVFVGIYWERYGWIAPTMQVSGLEDEYLLADSKPKLMYVKRPAPGRDPRLEELLDRIRADDAVAYKSFSDASELETLVVDDLSLLLSEAYLMEPTSRPEARRRYTLPGDATAFVGRAAELADVAALLSRPEVRLVTLTGPGGIGKTRLALHAGARAATSFEEGAVLVPLATVADERGVVTAIAAAVGLRDSGSTSLDGLVADLSGRSLLVVLDNFEHLVAASHVVSAIVDGTDRVKVVVTSREALRLRAEHEYAVPPFGADDGVAMFVERATAVRADFRLDDTNRAAVAAVCDRLEGVPLAIELAAARTRLLPPDALLARLDRRLEFLVGGPRDLPERQQALRRTIEWSHDLLDPSERRLFAVLGVFVGSFTLAAAEALVPAVGGEDDVLDLLASLVDKSLLRADAGAGEPRFRMLEMIAEYARERLDDLEDADRVRDLHADHFLEVGAAIGEGVLRGDQRRWLAEYGDPQDGQEGNLRSAFDRLLERGRLDDAAALAWSLWVPAWINGRITPGRAMVQAALDAPGGLAPRSRARLLVLVGMFRMWGGDHGESAAALDEGEAMATIDGDDDAVAAAVLARSMLAGPDDGEDRAEQLATETLRRYAALGDTWGEAAALNVLGWLHVAQERFADSAIFEQTLETSRRAGDEQFQALAEVNLAEHHMYHRRVEEASTLLQRCVERHRAQRLWYSIAYLLDGAARLAASTGDPQRSARLLGAADGFRRAGGVSVWGSQLVRRDRLVGEVAAALEPRAFDVARRDGATLGYDEALDEALPAAIPRTDAPPDL